MINQVCGQERKSGLCCALFQCTAWIVAVRFRNRLGANWAEIEFVIADSRGRIAERVVRIDHGGPFREVRLKRALPHITGVDQQHRATIFGPCSAQGVNVAGNRRQAAAVALRQQLTVHIICANDRNQDFVCRVVAGWRASDEQQQKRDYCEQGAIHR